MDFDQEIGVALAGELGNKTERYENSTRVQISATVPFFNCICT